MVSVRPNSDASSLPPKGRDPSSGDASGGGEGGVEAGGQPLIRLNLLLSCASWRADSWADRLPCLLEPMGIHSVRARSARQAERVIRTVPVHIAVVDLGLPLDESQQSGPSGPGEESGPRILELLARLEAPPPTVVVKGPRSGRDNNREMAAALRSGAFAVVDRAGVDVEQMLEVLRRCLHRFYHGRWPGSGSGSSGPCGDNPANPTPRRHWRSWSFG